MQNRERQMKWAAGAAGVLLCCLLVGVLAHRSAPPQPGAAAPDGSALDPQTAQSGAITGQAWQLSAPATAEELLLPGRGSAPSALSAGPTNELDAATNAGSNRIDLPVPGH